MKKVLTLILDGFGMREDLYGNAIKNAGMSNFIKIWNEYPHCLLKSSGSSVGLPKDQCGSSEIGHLLLGAGRSVKNNLIELTDAFEKNKIAANPTCINLIKKLKSSDKNLHICILLSDGGITSHINHLLKMLEYLKSLKLKNTIYLHLISDGKDSARNSFLNYYEKIKPYINENIKISTVCGRYYALDDTKDYKRTECYYNLLAEGEGVETPDLTKVIELCYSKKLTDEYIPPLKLRDYKAINKEDMILLLNFSRSNQKQLLESLMDAESKNFRKRKIFQEVYSLYEIDEKLNKNYFFKTMPIKHTLGEYISELGLSQARISEYIKRDSLNYYFNGNKTVNLTNCDVFIVDTLKEDSFDCKPEMNCLTVSKTIINSMEQDYDFIFANFANPDIVGHTGNYQATINGLQAIDVCLGKIITAAEENFYKIIIVGSHGKADTIINRENEILTKNTQSPVPLIILDKKVKLKNGDITMFAPTLLKYLDITIPQEMKDCETVIE